MNCFAKCVENLKRFNENSRIREPTKTNARKRKCKQHYGKGRYLNKTTGIKNVDSNKLDMGRWVNTYTIAEIAAKRKLQGKKLSTLKEKNIIYYSNIYYFL